MIRLPRFSGPVVWTAAVATLAVLYMGILIPLGTGPDEPEHAYRAYQLALGGLFPQLIQCAHHAMPLACGAAPGRLSPLQRAGGQVPAVLVAVFTQLYKFTHHHSGSVAIFKPSDYVQLARDTLSGPRRFANFENTALYSPVNYLPEIVVFWIAQHTSESVLAALFTARLVTGIIWAILVTAAVAIIPRWKWLFAMVVLVPTALTQSAVINADSETLGLVALTVAYVLRLADRAEPLRARQLVLVSVLVLLISLMKFPLPIVGFAVAAILWRCLGTGAPRARRAAAIVLPGLLAGAWWDIASNRYFVPYRDVVYAPALRALINVSQQEHYLFTHAYELPLLLWTTAIHGNLFQLWEVVGTLGEAGLPEWVAIAWIVAFVALAIGSESVGMTRAARYWLAGTLALYFLGTALALYLTWNTVGAGQIHGMHGRYFTLVLVLAVPLFAGLGGSRIQHQPRAIAGAVMTVSALCAGYMFVYASYHYYGQGPWQVIPKLTSTLL